MNAYKKFSVDEKLNAIERFHRGEPKTVIGRSLGISESTIRGWIKAEEKLKESKMGTRRGTKRSRSCNAETDDDCEWDNLNKMEDLEYFGYMENITFETDDECVLDNLNKMEDLEHLRYMKDLTFEFSKYFLSATEYFTNSYEKLSVDFKNLLNTIPLEYQQNLMIKGELESHSKEMIIKLVEEYIQNVDEILNGSKLFEEVRSQVLSTLEDSIKSEESAIRQPSEM